MTLWKGVASRVDKLLEMGLARSAMIGVLQSGYGTELRRPLPVADSPDLAN
jgi:hypothetical protein